jgi:ribosomal peptide maturation radical SAM protein 1
LKFRSKPQDQALEDLKTLADKYQQHEFHCVDNILHEQHYRDFLNQLSSDEYDLSIFFEVKSNIKLTDLIRLKKAGVWCIQPGIESLSTEILKLMNKGVTGIQNIRLLKFCAWLDIGVSWNLLYGFPGEPQDEYTRIADLMKSIYHFQPPNLSVLALQKTSYYYNNAIQVGLKILGPSSFYKALYGPGNGELKKIATFFDYEHVDGRDPSVYINKVKKELKKWKSKWPASKEMLSYYCTKEKVTIIDKRIHLTPSIYKLDPLESYIYKQCFDIISLDKLAQNEKLTSVGLEIEDIEQFCRSLIDKRLMYREGNQLLALAVPTRKPTQLRMWSVDHDNTD